MEFVSAEEPLQKGAWLLELGVRIDGRVYGKVQDSVRGLDMLSMMLMPPVLKDNYRRPIVRHQTLATWKS